MSSETDFMGELEAASRLKPTMASNIFLFSIVALVLFFMIWASVSEIEELTRGSGSVVPSQEIQVLQSLEGGILAQLLVHEGDIVKKGQILLRISDVAFSSEGRGAEARSLSLRAKKTRLSAEANATVFELAEDIIKAVPKISENEKALYDSRQKQLVNAKAIFANKISGAQAQIAETRAEIKRIKDNRALLYQELKITQKMVKQRALPKLNEIRLKREVSDLSGQVKTNEEKQIGLKAELSAVKKELENQDDKFRSQALGELNEVETNIRQLNESMKSIEDRVYRTELRAPVAGIVNNITVKTIGGVIEPAHKLIEIVPIDDELKIMAKILPKDIAFLRVGQNVKVKVTAYDSTIYGSLTGKLVRIGATSVSDRQGNVFFEIEVHTDKNYLGTEERKLPITPGMVASIEVVTGKRTIMKYLMKPILRARARALRER